MSTTMQLRSGRPVTRSETRSYKALQEKKRYQREQRVVEESIYDEEENTLAKKMKKFNHKLCHLLYVNQYQKEQRCTFNEKMQTVIDVYEHARYNIDDLIQYYNNEHKHDTRLLVVMVRRGHLLLLEMYNKKRTREENKNFKKCEDLILFVSDLIEEYVL